MGALLNPDRAKVARLIPRLSSNHDGEVVATARAIGRTLIGLGADWHDLAAAVEKEPPPQVVVQWRDRPVATASLEPKNWPELARWVRDHDKGRLAENERAFVRDMCGRLVMNGQPTEKQASWLRRLYAKVGGPAGC